jgi:hypothetical protein
MIEKQITLQQALFGFNSGLKYFVKGFGRIDKVLRSKNKVVFYNNAGLSINFTPLDLEEKITIIKKSEWDLQ